MENKKISTFCKRRMNVILCIIVGLFIVLKVIGVLDYLQLVLLLSFSFMVQNIYVGARHNEAIFYWIIVRKNKHPDIFNFIIFMNIVLAVACLLVLLVWAQVANFI